MVSWNGPEDPDPGRSVPPGRSPGYFASTRAARDAAPRPPHPDPPLAHPRVGGLLLRDLGSSRGPEALLGLALPGFHSSLADRAFAGVINVEVPGDLDDLDLYGLELLTARGWRPAPRDSLGPVIRPWWGAGPRAGAPESQSIAFRPLNIDGHWGYETPGRWEARHGLQAGAPSCWPRGRHLSLPWWTEGQVPDGLWRLRLVGWRLRGGRRVDARVLPLDGFSGPTDLAVGVDNSRAAAISPGRDQRDDLSEGTRVALLGLRLDGQATPPDRPLSRARRGALSVDLLVHDPQGQLSRYVLSAVHETGEVINLTWRGRLEGGEPWGLAPSAGRAVGPGYLNAVCQGAARPRWCGGTVTLCLPSLAAAFPRPGRWRLQLRAWRRVIRDSQPERPVLAGVESVLQLCD